jgi:hypothetical protein
MQIEELEKIEREESVNFVFKPTTGTIAVKGKPAAVDRGLERIKGQRDEVAGLLRARQAPEDEIVEREVAFSVPSKAVQRQNYIFWFMKMPRYYWPSEAELDVMFGAIEEGDLVIPDFAHSFTVRRPNGLLVSVDRKGRVSQPSPYSPAMQK